MFMPDTKRKDKHQVRAAINVKNQWLNVTGQSRYNEPSGVHRTQTALWAKRVIASAVIDQVWVGKHLYLGVFQEYMYKKWHFLWFIYINK